MIPAEFEYVAPTSVEEAVRVLTEAGEDAKVLAGGQSLIPVLRMRLAAPNVPRCRTCGSATSSVASASSRAWSCTRWSRWTS